ncbi:MAG: lysylphosphatidylglycerol synthase transmembrane domain-containing protein [Chloroflexota bacterium]
MRKFLLALVFLLAVYFFISRFAEAQQVVATLQRGDWRWLLAAGLLQITNTINIGASFRAIYRGLGLEERIERLVPLAAAAYFVNVVAPVGGMSGMAVLIAEAKRRGQPVGRVSTAAALVVLYDYAAFLMVLALGLLVLFRRNQLATAEVVASLFLLGIAIGIGTLVYLGMRSAEQLGQALRWLASGVNRVLRPFIHREYLNVGRANEFAHDAAEGLRLLRSSRGNLLMPLALAMSAKALLISILFMVFMAFSQPFSVGTLIAGFSIAYLFLIISPTPSGIGFVEGILTLTLASLRVPLAAAAVIALAYRGVTFWFPLAYGALAFRWVGRPVINNEA